MQAKIRIYQQNTLRTAILEGNRTYSVGTLPGCDYQFNCGGGAASILFQQQGGKWRATCTGTVYLGRQAVQDVYPKPGDFFVIDPAQHLAVMFLDEHEVGTISLHDLDTLTIGRTAANMLQLPDPTISSNHALMLRQGDGWQIQDQRSASGTYVNGAQIRNCPLNNNDSIFLGQFRLQLIKDLLVIYSSSIEPAVHVKQTNSPAPSEPPKALKPQPKPYPFFTRSPRLRQTVPSGVLEIEAAPPIGQKPEINWFTTLLPSLGGVILMLVMSLATGMSPTSLLFSAPMTIIGVVMTIINYNKQTKNFSQADAMRNKKYEQYLAQCEDNLKSASNQQKSAILSSNPDLRQCLQMVSQLDRNLWTRTRSDADFLSVRVGIGDEPLALTVNTPKIALMAQEDTFTHRPQQLADKYRTITGVPIMVDLLRLSNLGIVGSRAESIQTAHSLIVHLTTHHGYDEVKLVVLYPQNEADQWEWMRWLPHTFDNDRENRFMACTSFEASKMLAPIEADLKQRAANAKDLLRSGQINGPHYVFLIADPSLLHGRPLDNFFNGHLGVSTILLSNTIAALPQAVQQIVEIDASYSQIYAKDQASQRRALLPDTLTLADCDRFARSMAPVRLPAQKDQQLPSLITFLDGYHISRVDNIDLDDFWNNAIPEKTLAVPIGIRENGEPFYFDIHEKKHGPHGMVAGTSGSGKSEMAQTWIASMALQFSPRDVNFILVDFKGTSLLQPFRNLPHLAGSISNLDKDIQRNLLALNSEMEHRQVLFDRYGCNDIIEYLSKRRRNPHMEEMPFLIIVFDEFAEFKAQFPDFTNALNHIFRGGRSLGVFSMIMTQKPSGVVTDQMNANANFRWCLKVQSESDSRELLGENHAAYIRNPGRSYVKCGDGTFELIQSFYSGAAYRPGSTSKANPTVCSIAVNGEKKSFGPAQSKTTGSSGESQLDAIVRTISEYCQRKHIPSAKPIWTEKLPEKLELSSLLPLQKLWDRLSDWSSDHSAPIARLALVDDPAHQQQLLLTHDFWKDGHLLTYGMPMSGKTTFLQTLLLSLCNVYTPEQVQMYMMEFGGFGLRSLETFPHVGGAAGDDEPEVMLNIASLFQRELERRKKLFRSLGVGSMNSYSDACDDILPTWILLIDNMNLLNNNVPELMDPIMQLSREGAAYGMYLAVTITGSSGVSYQLLQNFKTTMTLQLTDRMDYSSIVGRTSGNIPQPLIGRGLVRGPLEFQTAIAFADLTDGKRIAALRRIADQMRVIWDGPLPTRIASMPDHIPYGSIKALPFVLGLSHASLEPVCLPFAHTTGLLVSAGDEESKNRLLTLLLKQAADIPNSSVLLCSPVLSCQGAQVLRTAAELDAALMPLVQELRNRQKTYKADPSVTFDPIIIVLDRFVEYLSEAALDTTSRLEVFVRLGKGLGITIIAADLAAAVSRRFYSNDILMTTLHEGNIAIVGGQASDHAVVDTLALSKIQQDAIAEGVLVLENNKEFDIIKQMDCDE